MACILESGITLVHPGISLTSQTWFFLALFCKLLISSKHWILWGAAIDSWRPGFYKRKTTTICQTYYWNKDELKLFRFGKNCDYRLLLAIITRWGPYWAGDVPELTSSIYRLALAFGPQVKPKARAICRLMTSAQERHRLSAALIGWLSPIMRKVYTKYTYRIATPNPALLNIRNEIIRPSNGSLRWYSETL